MMKSFAEPSKRTNKTQALPSDGGYKGRIFHSRLRIGAQLNCTQNPDSGDHINVLYWHDLVFLQEGHPDTIYHNRVDIVIHSFA